MTDTPQITAVAYGSASTGFQPAVAFQAAKSQADEIVQQLESVALHQRRARDARRAENVILSSQLLNQELVEQSMANPRRIVQVFIADPHPDVPLEKSLIHKGEMKFTDATDQELYFEVPINALLAAHNEARVKWLDKEATRRSGRDVFLEPCKIRDLKMVVVNVATF